MAANTDTVERRKRDASDEGAFIGQVRQRGHVKQLLINQSMQERMFVPNYEQWDGKNWVGITLRDDRY